MIQFVENLIQKINVSKSVLFPEPPVTDQHSPIINIQGNDVCSIYSFN